MLKTKNSTSLLWSRTPDCFTIIVICFQSSLIYLTKNAKHLSEVALPEAVEICQIDTQFPRFSFAKNVNIFDISATQKNALNAKKY